MKASHLPAFKLRLTANGWVFLLAVVTIFLVSINYSNNLIFSFCFILLAVFLVSFWLNLRNILGIEGRVIAADPVHAGQSLVYRVLIENSSAHHKAQLHITGATELVSVASGDSAYASVSQTVHERGQRPEQAVRVASRWPLELFELSCEVCLCPTVLIYPQAVEHKPVQLRTIGDDAHLHDASDELAGLKAYQTGDNLRRVHWKSLAKHDQWVVRQFDGEEGEPSGWLCWDDTVSLQYEERISCLTEWVVYCYTTNREFGLRLPNRSITPAKGSQQLYQCLSALAVLPYKEGSAPC